MRRAAIAQLGSTDIDTVKWATYVSEQVIRRIIPISLRAVARLVKDKGQHKALLDAALRCEQEGTKDAADAAVDAADAADARDRVLSLAAEICVEACVECGTQGSKWLDITEEVAA